jgi:hypothetical protein
MATKTLSRKACADISNAAHHATYQAFSNLFLDKHDFIQGRLKAGGMFITHGYKTEDDDVVPISTLVVGGKLIEKHRYRQVGALSIARTLRQSFVGNQVYLADDVQVPVKKLMEHVTRFLMDYEQQVDVFAGIYENKLTNTNVLGIYIMIKDVDEDSKRLAWEITIDDHDLRDELSAASLFFKQA